jgi:hypothetical protein
MESEFKPLHFIDEPILVFFNKAPVLEKKPDCPDGFSWQGRTYQVVELLAAWVDYQRRGRLGRNMQPKHAAVASSRGSWGVGRFSFSVRVETGQIYQIYYDRAPKDIDNRKGNWFLLGEYTRVGE